MRKLVEHDEHMLIIPKNWDTWVTHARAHRRLLRFLIGSTFPWNVFGFGKSAHLGTDSYSITPIMDASRACCTHHTLDVKSATLRGVLIRAETTRFDQVTTVCDIPTDASRCAFDPEKYRDLNFDIRTMGDDAEVTRHFIHHGWQKEHRMFWYPDHPIKHLPTRRNKDEWSCVALLNHASDVSGAPWVCYSIFAELVDQRVDDVYLFTPHACPVLMDKLDLSKNARKRIIEYEHNPHALLDAIRLLSVDTLVINSFSSEFLSMFPRVRAHVDRIVQYVHEDYNDYIPNQVPDVTISGDLVLTADHETRSSFRKNGVRSSVYPPKFRIDAYEKLSRHYSVFDTVCEMGLSKFWTLSTRNVVGMVGTPNERKNFDYFCALAQACPQYVFVWIGGDETLWFSTNVLLIQKTPCLTMYMRLFDIFLLTSNRDYCPVVLLEALAMNIPCIAFKDALMYKHKKCAHLHLLKGRIQDKEPTEFEPLFEAAIKSRNDEKSGSDYIKRDFVYKSGEVRKRLGVQNK
jgi:glycosyltransferase involved in cell wall biosynthesis